MTVTQSGVESGGRAAQFEPIIRRSSPQERVIAWPDSRDDFGIARDARSARRIRSAGPSVHATVRSSAGTVELGGMTTRAITEARAHYLMEDELDRIWAWAVFWGLVPSGSSPGNRAHGGERGHPSHH